MKSPYSKKNLHSYMDSQFDRIHQPLLKSWVSYHQKWYDQKADRNRIYAHLQIVLSLCTPLLATLGTTYASNKWVKVSVIVLSGLIAIALGLLSFMRCGEQWVRYRTVGETLKRLTFRFLYDVTHPDETDPSAVQKYINERCIQYIEEIDTMIGNELEEWSKQRLKSIQEEIGKASSSATK